jgi:hypothetical protein
MDDVAIDQGIADLQDALIKEDAVGLVTTGTVTGAHDGVVEDAHHLHGAGIAEVDRRRLCIASSWRSSG